MFKCHQVFGHAYPTNSISDKRAQSFYLKSLQEDIGHLWKGNVRTESPVNNNAQSKTSNG